MTLGGRMGRPDRMEVDVYAGETISDRGVDMYVYICTLPKTHSFLVARVLGFSRKVAKTVSIETGMQNS